MIRIALIHALAHSIPPINAAFERDWPQALRMNLLDDSLSADLAREGKGLDAAMHERFQRLAQYAVDTGAQGILFTCSAFGPCPSRARSAERLSSSRFIRSASGQSRSKAALMGATEWASAWIRAMRVMVEASAQMPFDDGLAKPSFVSALSG